MKPIICVGHAALDFVYRIEAFPETPTKVRSLEHIESGGGMAANAAAAIARLGGTVELWSRTGADSAGARILRLPRSRRRRRALRQALRGRPLVDLGRHRRRQGRSPHRRRARSRHVHGCVLASARSRGRCRGGAERPALAGGNPRSLRVRPRGRRADAARCRSRRRRAPWTISSASPTTRSSPSRRSTRSRPRATTASGSDAC